MPAPKRDSSPHESQPKMRKLEEDGDAMPSKTAPAALKTGDSPERTGAPRTKKKMSPSPEINKSQPSSPSSDSSESASYPPFKKAKLQAKSASSQPAPSETANSKGPLKRTASTESDDESSSDGGKGVFFRVRDDGDKAHCIRQYSNKTKRKAEEPLSDPLEANEESPFSERVQMDHNYGRYSDISDQETEMTSSEAQTPKDSNNATDTGTNIATKTECQAEPSNCERIPVLESHIRLDSSADILDNGASVPFITSDNKETEIAESSTELQSKKDDDDKILPISVLYPVESVQSNQKDQLCDLSFRPEIVTDLQTEKFIEVTDESVSVELEPDIKCNTEVNEHKTLPLIEEAQCIVGAECQPLLNETMSEPEQFLVVSSIPDRPSEDSALATTQVSHLETQADKNAQVVFEEDVKFEQVQDQLCHEVSDAFTETCDGVNEVVTKENETLQTPDILTSNSFISDDTAAKRDLENHNVIDYTPEIKDAVMVQEKANAEDVSLLNGQLKVDIQTEATEAITIAAVEIQSLNKSSADVNMETEAVSPYEEKECIHEVTEAAPGTSQDVNEYEMAQNNNMTADSPEIFAPVPTVDVQGENNLNTSDQCFEVPENNKVTQHEESQKVEIETIDFATTSDIIHREITVNINKRETTEVSEHNTHLLYKVDCEPVTADANGEINSTLEATNPSDAAAAIFSQKEVNREATEMASNLSPTLCTQYQGVSETTMNTKVEQIEYSALTENVEAPTEYPNQIEMQPVSVSHISTSVENQKSIIMQVSDQVPCAREVEEVLKPSNEAQSLNDQNKAIIVTQQVQNYENICGEDAMTTMEAVSPVEMPTSSTYEIYHESPEPSTIQAEEVQESFISNAFTDYTKDDVTVYSDVQTIATEEEEEVSEPTSTVEFDTSSGQEVRKQTSNYELRDLITDNTESDKEVIPGCIETNKMEIQPAEQEVVEEEHTEVTTCSEVQNENVQVTEIQVPQEINQAPSVVMEVDEQSVAFSSEIQSVAFHSETMDSVKMQMDPNAMCIHEDKAVISGSPETGGAVTENTETNTETREFSEVDSSNLIGQTDQVVYNAEMQEPQSSEVTVYVCSQQDDIVVVHSVDEQQDTEVKSCENQIVYEPISSPESTTDGEILTLSANNDRLMQIGSGETQQIIYTVSALSTNEEMEEVHLQTEEYSREQVDTDSHLEDETICVPSESFSVIQRIDELSEVNSQQVQNDKTAVKDSQAGGLQTDVSSSLLANEEIGETIDSQQLQKEETVEKEMVMDSQKELQSLQSSVTSSPANEGICRIEERQLQNVVSSRLQMILDSYTAAAEIQNAQERTVIAQLEKSNGAEAVNEVALSSLSEDSGTPIGQSKAEEKKGESVAPQQVQEVTGVEVVQDTTPAATTVTATELENQEVENQEVVNNGTSEEYVILEPVPDTEIDYDIITQAVAESGLSEELTVTETQSVLNEGEVQLAVKVKDPTNNEESKHELEVAVESSVHNADIYQQPTETMEVTPAESSEPRPEVTEQGDVNMEPEELQILEDFEIGREIVVAEQEQEEDGDISIIEKPQETTLTEDDAPKKTDENIVEENKADTSSASAYQDSTADENTETEKKEPEKPKKQEMNTQARTKARLAALAQEKAAASKRQAKREQLNLLALCQEIAEDIATDSMLLKRIEEEKQAAAAAAAAAKTEATKEESPPVTSQEEQKAEDVETPAGPEANQASETPPEETLAAQPSTTVTAEEAKPTTDQPKRRFFISQVTVPLKAHEKKKLTRYQKLRQVELQREKMSWARVKKLKSDQANQMFSDMDWQASMSFSSILDPVAATSQPATSPVKPPPASPTPTTKPLEPETEETEVETPKAESIKSEPAKTETHQNESAKEEIEKPESSKPETTKKAEPKPELRKSTRISKIESSKAASTPAPATPTPKGKTKKVLPAVPPPMPNGLNNQSLKIEYKPYRPRPKYSPDDFEMDDDPIPITPKPSPQSRPVQQRGPNVVQQVRPGTQTTATPSMVASSNQVRPKVMTPARQISGQQKPTSTPQPRPPAQQQAQTKATHATPSSSKPSPADAKVLQNAPVSTTPQTKTLLPAVQSKSAAAASSPSPQVHPTSATPQKQTTPAVAQPTTSETKPAVNRNVEKDEAKCKDPEAVPVATVAPKEDVKVSDGSLQCQEKQKDTDADEKNTEPEKTTENSSVKPMQDDDKPQAAETPLSEASLQKELKKLKEADKDGTQTIIDAGQKHFGPVACSVCGMLYSAANPEDESQHLLFHNQFISAVKYVGWKKERILSEFPDGKIILVLPDDPKYALKKIEEIREMVDSDLGFQQVVSKCPSKTKTFLFISNDKKVAGCLIAEHINEGYRVIEDPAPVGSEGEKVMFERQRAWCCSTTSEPAICGISRIWVVSTMRRQGIASRMLDCLRSNFIFGSNLSKDEIAFSDPTPDGKLFATRYFGTSQFLVYNFVSGNPTTQAKTETV